jgi:hypothetical protein
LARRVFVLHRIYCTIPKDILSTYLPKSMSFVPAGTDLAVKLLMLIFDICEHDVFL